MFDSIRKHQRVLQFVLLLLIFPAFAFFGMSGYGGFLSGADEVATVKGQPITRQEFTEAQRRQIENMRRMLGDKIDVKMFDTDAARAEVLESLVAQHSLLADANARHVAIPDARLREAIASIPGLSKPDGSFDREQYRSLLAAQGMSESMFESQLRRDLALQTIPEAVAQTGFLPRSVTDRLNRLEHEQREVRERLFKPEDYEAQVKPTAEQVRKYFDDNGSEFESPESAKVEYVILTADAIAAQVAIDPAKISDFYAQNKARYTTEEERKASHILLTLPKDAKDDVRKEIRAKADGLLAQAKGGADFAALAKAHSQDPGSAAQGGDLGFFSHSAMVKPFADKAFSLKSDEVSDVVETQFGFHIIKLTGIKAASVRAFEDVKAEIETEFRKQEATREYAKAAETFNNTVYEQSDSLKPVADKLKLKIETAENVNRFGGPTVAKLAAFGNPKLLSALFSADSIKNRRNIDAVEIAPNTLASARLVDYQPAKRKEFAEVQEQARLAVVRHEARKLAILAGEAQLKALKEGAPVSGFGPVTKLARTGANTIPVAAVEAIFRSPAEKLPAFVGQDTGGLGYAVYQIVKIVPIDEKALTEKSAVSRSQYTQLHAQHDMNQYLETVKARSDVKRHLERLKTSSAEQ